MSSVNPTRTPLETFLLDFVDQYGGVWEEVEPQVYDVMLASDQSDGDIGGREVLRVAFDPDALPEHADAQLAGFGTPLMDGLLSAASRRGRLAGAYLRGLNLTPHGLTARVERALTWPDAMTLELSAARAQFFRIALFWFEATFLSDQKEHEILPIGFDLHYARQVRHLDRLLAADALGDQPDVFLPDASHASPAELFPLAREQVTRTLVSLANTRARELNERVQRQVARMQRYYRDLRSEMDSDERRAQQRGGDVDKFARRRESLEREERLRIAELRQKSSLEVHLRLANLLLIRQPKLRLDAHLISGRGHDHPLELIWDPLLESLEAVPCPACHAPTLFFSADRYHRPCCPSCAKQPAPRTK